MNGAPLALGLAGLLVGASALARRGSRNAVSPYVPEPSAPVRGAWWRDAEGARWTQAHDTLVRDALSDWKGDPSQIRLHMQDELSGAAMPGSGSGKIARARARALLWEIQNKARATPPLFRGALRQEGEWLSWTTSRRVAETFARKGGGQVIQAKKGCKGLRVADYLGQDPERQWILQQSARSGLESVALATPKGARNLALSESRRRDLDRLAEACGAFTREVGGHEPVDMRRFAKKHGVRYLGSGYKRDVFSVPEGALKVERGHAPYGDNTREATLWAGAPRRLAKLLVPVLATADDHRWNLMEEVEIGGRSTKLREEEFQACGLWDFYAPRNLSKDGRLVDYGYIYDPVSWRECLDKGAEQRDVRDRGGLNKGLWFHASSVKNRASIAQHGLLLSRCFLDGLTPVGIYFTENPPEPKVDKDVWRVDLSGYTLLPDPYCGEDLDLGDCVYVTKDVPAVRLSRLAR